MNPDNAADPTVSGSSATSGVNEEQLKQTIQKVVMGIMKDAVPRIVQQSLQSSMPTLLDKLAEEALKEAPATEAVTDGGAQPEKVTMKALQQQLAEMQRGIKERDEQIKAERQRATETRLKADVRSHFAKHLGADSPHLEPYVNMWMAQFADQDGRTARKVKNEYGEETFVPVDKAVEDLFKSDLKHLVQPTRNQNLPHTGLVRGQVMDQSQGQRRPGFVEQALQQLATANPDLAPSINPNGTPQK